MHRPPRPELRRRGRDAEARERREKRMFGIWPDARPRLNHSHERVRRRGQQEGGDMEEAARTLPNHEEGDRREPRTRVEQNASPVHATALSTRIWARRS